MFKTFLKVPIAIFLFKYKTAAEATTKMFMQVQARDEKLIINFMRS